MQLLSIFGIAIALAMDAFAVAIATGVNLGNASPRQTFRLSFHFGLFQALMPLIGWTVGSRIETYIEAYAHWVAFVLLVAVGTNMLREAIANEEDDEPTKRDNTRGMTMVMLSIATSIDALAVGLSISMMRGPILLPALIIGVVACLFTIIGLRLGGKVAGLARLSNWAEISGGIVLWLIGLNILRESGVFHSLFG